MNESAGSTGPPRRRQQGIPFIELADHGLGDGRRSREAGEIECRRVQSVELGQLRHEVLRRRFAFGRIRDVREPALPLEPLRQHGVVRRVDPEQSGHRDGTARQGAVDRRFAAQRPGVFRGLAVGAVVVQEERCHPIVRPVEVDEPGLFAAASGLAVDVDDFSPADLLDPRHQVVGKAHSGVAHRTAPVSFSARISAHPIPSSNRIASVCSPCAGARVSTGGIPSNWTGLATSVNDVPSSVATSTR